MIAIHHLSYGYGKQRILDDIDVTISAGDFYAVLSLVSDYPTRNYGQNYPEQIHKIAC